MTNPQFGKWNSDNQGRADGDYNYSGRHGRLKGDYPLAYTWESPEAFKARIEKKREEMERTGKAFGPPKVTFHYETSPCVDMTHKDLNLTSDAEKVNCLRCIRKIWKEWSI